eukprot:7242727-Pyramimonas_sp.AAC.1
MQCLKFTKSQAGFDQDMAKSDELADMPTQGSNARGGPEAEPPQEDGRPPTIHEEPEADIEAHIMEVRYTEFKDERELLEATPAEELYTAPTHMISDNSALVAVAEEQQGVLPTWGNPQDIYTTEAYHVSLCCTGEDDSCELDSDEHERTT